MFSSILVLDTKISPEPASQQSVHWRSISSNKDYCKFKILIVFIGLCAVVTPSQGYLNSRAVDTIDKSGIEFAITVLVEGPMKFIIIIY